MVQIRNLLCMLGYKRPSDLSFWIYNEIHIFPTCSRFPLSFPESFFVLVIVLSQVQVRLGSQVVGAQLVSDVVVSWEAFVRIILHLRRAIKSFKETVKRASTFPIFYFVFSPVLSSKV